MVAQQTDTQAQVGIGTLIVFIAMVLVAAIAAGVLINTAGFLQVQAEDTGEESTEQVADNLNVITEVGVIGDSDERVDEIRIGVQPAAGAGVLNLEEVTAQFVSDNSFGTFVHVKSASTTSASAVFNTESVTSDNGENNIMTENTDRYELVFPLGDQRPFLEEAVVLDGGEETALAISEDGDEVLAADDEDADRPAKLDLVVNDDVEIDQIAEEFDGVESVTEVAVEDGEVQNAGDAELFAESTIDDAEELDDDDDFETSAESANFDGGDDVQRVVAFTEEVDTEALDGFDEEADELDDEFLAALDNDEGLDPLHESEESELTLTTEVGAQTITVLKVPDTLASETEGDGVDL